MKKIRVSVISYLNTVPFLYGLCNHAIKDVIDIKLCTPSQSASDIISGKTDVAILPSAIIPELGEDKIISDFCIGANGKVASVLLCSNKPIEEIDHLCLDIDSRTSVVLAKILMRNHWKKSVTYSSCDYTNDIPDSLSSCLLIGDKALRYSYKFSYVYDLAEEWIKYKSMPFVFACWASYRKLDNTFINEFNNALKYGLSNIPKAVDSYSTGFDRDFSLDYLSNNISYPLSPDKRKGLSEFWSLAPEELKSKVRRRR